MDIIEKINNADSIWEILPDLSEKKIEQVIKLAADSYYNSDVSLISDSYYDILVERLKEINPKSKVLHQTGAPVRGKKVTLPYWMGSMDKIKADEKLIIKWVLKYIGPYVISDKLDGISCLLTIINGKTKLYTRGNGNIGQDISHLLELVNMGIDYLSESDHRENIAIRGELIMTKKNFEKYANIMSNARNMVAGIVNAKPSSVNKKYAADVDFVAYEIIEPVDKSSEQMIILKKKWKLNTVYYDIYEYIDTEILDDLLRRRKKRCPYEIDGIIVTDDGEHNRNTSGNPKYSFAYKGMTPTANVRVIEVLWKPSKDGFLVPTVHFEKVRLSQAVLEYATGFNAKFIVTNNIGPGAIIKVVRSGDVIPYIIGVIKPAKQPSLPENKKYDWDDNDVNIILKNADKNETVIIQRLTKFVKYIGVDNMSEGIITRLVHAGYDTIPKIINLTVDDMLDIEGFGKRLSNKLYDNLQTALDELDLLTLMAASNIFGRGFGERKIKKILDEYPNIVDDYSKKTHNKWYDNLMSLDGFDTITVDNFISELPFFQDFYDKISKFVNVREYKKVLNKRGIFTNETIVFTGFRNKDWQKWIEKEGGKVTGSVSKNTTLLVYNDGEESSAKYKKAVSLNIDVISKSQFAKKYKLN